MFLYDKVDYLSVSVLSVCVYIFLVFFTLGVRYFFIAAGEIYHCTYYWSPAPMSPEQVLAVL